MWNIIGDIGNKEVSKAIQDANSIIENFEKMKEEYRKSKFKNQYAEAIRGQIRSTIKELEKENKQYYVEELNKIHTYFKFGRD